MNDAGCMSKKTMLVLSFDIGVRNLGVCLMHLLDGEASAEPTFRIRHWEVIDTLGPDLQTKPIKKIPLQSLITCVLKALDGLILKVPELITEVDVILIENQPKFNVKMKSLSLCLYSYFVLRGVVDAKRENLKIEYVHARHKLDSLRHPEASLPECRLKSAYARRKHDAIHLTRFYLQQCADSHSHWESFFEGLHKKDDAADCFLQALWYQQKGTVKTKK